MKVPEAEKQRPEDSSEGTRGVLGLGLAIVAPGLSIAFGLFMTKYSSADQLPKFASGVLQTVGLTALVTIPATLIPGLVAIAVLAVRQWHDWPRHAIAGAIVGMLVLTVVSGFSLSHSFSDFVAAHLICGALGATASSAYWLAVFAGRRIWLSLATVIGLLIAGRLIFVSVI